MVTTVGGCCRCACARPYSCVCVCVYVCVDIMMPISRALNFRLPTLRGIARISVLSAFSARQRRLRDAVLSKRIRNLSVSMRARARAKHRPQSQFRRFASLSLSRFPLFKFFGAETREFSRPSGASSWTYCTRGRVIMQGSSGQRARAQRCSEPGNNAATIHLSFRSARGSFACVRGQRSCKSYHNSST